MRLDSFFGSLVQKNHKSFFGFVRSKVDSDEVAEDILQSAYERGLKKIPTLRADEKLVSWFYRILRNAIIDHYRHRAVEKKRFSLDEIDLENIPVSPDKQMEKTICGCMTDLLPTLKPEYSDVIHAVELGDSDLADYSKSKKITKNTATVRLYRARQSLKKRLIQTCGHCASHGCLDCHCKKKV